MGDIGMLKGGACLSARGQRQGRQGRSRSPELRRPRGLRRRQGLPREKRGKKQINIKHMM